VQEIPGFKKKKDKKSNFKPSSPKLHVDPKEKKILIDTPQKKNQQQLSYQESPIRKPLKL